MLSLDYTKKVHQVFVKNKIKQLSTEKASPKHLIKVFDQQPSSLKVLTNQTSSSVLVQQTTPNSLNWNKYELQVTLRLSNPDFLSNNSFNSSVEQLLSQKLNLECEKKYSVGQTKEIIELTVRKNMPSYMTCDVVELRLGDRLSLPNTAILSSLLKHSKFYQLDITYAIRTVLTTALFYSRQCTPFCHDNPLRMPRHLEE